MKNLFFSSVILFSLITSIQVNAVQNQQQNNNVNVKITKTTIVKQTPTKTTQTQQKQNQTAKIQNTNQQKKEPLIHIVKEGETIYRIALNYKVSQDDLRKVNKLNNNNIWVGERLVMPEGAVKPEEEKTNNTTENVHNTNQQSNTTAKIDDKTKAEEEKTAKAQNQVIDTSKVAIKTQEGIVNQIDSTTFLWPVRGTIISKFGHLTNSGKLEGVNIATEKGAIIRASSAGEVVYNSKVEGYDNVILIRHYNGFITAYGHTDPLVVVGDKINKGQVIAYVAPNQQSKRAMLYFSIRKNKKSYDPEKVISTKLSE